MTTIEYSGLDKFNVKETSVEGVDVQYKLKKPGAVIAVSVLMYLMAVFFVFAVLGGKPAAAIFIPLIVYLAYGLSILKASARTGTIVFAWFGLLVNAGAYIFSSFTMHTVLVDVGFYVVILALLLSPSARNAQWMKKTTS